MHQKVVRYRQEQELTQAQLAERVGCTERHIQGIEAGDYNARFSCCAGWQWPWDAGRKTSLETIMKPCNLAAALVVAAATTAASAPAFGYSNATRISFPRGSYCGSFSGEISTPHRFLLGLRSGQVLRVETSGETYPVKVVGPTGEVAPSQHHGEVYNYQLPASGDYAVAVRSQTGYARLQFCAN